MGILEFFFFVVIVVALGYFTIFILGRLAPGHPGVIDNIIWIVVVLFIVVLLVTATGLTGINPQIPRVR